MYRKIQRRRDSQALFGPEEERRHANRNADPETNAFINQYTSLGDRALKEPRENDKVVSIAYYTELADIYLNKPRKLGN